MGTDESRSPPVSPRVQHAAESQTCERSNRDSRSFILLRRQEDAVLVKKLFGFVLKFRELCGRQFRGGWLLNLDHYAAIWEPPLDPLGRNEHSLQRSMGRLLQGL